MEPILECFGAASGSRLGGQEWVDPDLEQKVHLMSSQAQILCKPWRGIRALVFEVALGRCLGCQKWVDPDVEKKLHLLSNGEQHTK